MEHASAETLHRRFLGPKPRLSGAELRYLTEVDMVDHVALVAIDARRPDILLGVGRWVRDVKRPDEAEMAIVIADEVQGQGLGTVLAQDLAELAREGGVARFTATTLAENRAAHRLFARISTGMVLRSDGPYAELVAELGAPPAAAVAA